MNPLHRRQGGDAEPDTMANDMGRKKLSPVCKCIAEIPQQSVILAHLDQIQQAWAAVAVVHKRDRTGKLKRTCDRIHVTQGNKRIDPVDQSCGDRMW